MNVRHGLRRLSVRIGGATIWASGFLIVILAPAQTRAVSVVGSTYAAETGGPTPNPTFDSYNITNLTSASASIRSDVKYSHAQSSAQATVTCSGVTKSTGGRGWADTPPTATAPLYDTKSNLWNASASGTQVVANYIGPGTPPPYSPFHFVIPGGGIAAPFNAFPGNGPDDPPEMLPPASGQGFVVNGGGGGPGSLPSFYDIFIQVNATAQQGTGQAVSLFQGTLLFDPSTLETTTTGDFVGLTPTITAGGNPGQFFVSLPTIQGRTFDAVADQPFNMDFNVYMTMGDPNHQYPGDPNFTPGDYDFSALSGGPVGVVGGFAASMLVNDPGSFMVSPVAPTVNLVWNGASGDANWSTTANWVGGVAPVATNALTFDGNTTTTTNNDLPPNTQINGITFAPTAGAFTLSGNPLLLAGNITDNSPNPQTIALGLTYDGGVHNVDVAAGGALALGALTFGATPQSTSFTTLNVNNNVVANSLAVQTNTSVASAIDIAAGATFNINSMSDGTTNGPAFVVGRPQLTASPATTSLRVAGPGTLVVNSVSSDFVVGVGNGNNSLGAASATLDMSGLANFVYNGSGIGSFYVGFGTRTTGTLHLANTSNAITANNLTVGDSAQTPGFTLLGSDNNPDGTSRLYLGAGTNVLNLGATLVIGNTQASGTVQFETTAGSVAINGLDPIGNPGQVPDLVVGRHTVGNGAAAGSLALAGHSAAVQAGAVAIGVGAGPTGPTSGVVTFDTGAFTANSVNLAVHSNGAGAVNGTFILGGPQPNATATGVLTVNGPFTLANRTVAGNSPDAGAFIINGGLANINADIVNASTQGTRTTSLDLEGGTLNMTGHSIGSPAAPIGNVQLVAAGGQATLANLGGSGIITGDNPGGGLVMNGSGQLNLAGVNTYNGPTTINAGTLSVVGSIVGGGPVLDNGGTLAGNGDGVTTGIMGNVNVSGGQIHAGAAPGAIGMLTMSNLIFHSGNLTADLGSSQAADRLVVPGNLVLGDAPGSPLSLTLRGAPVTGNYEIIDYGGTLSRNADFAVSGPLGFTYTVDYNTVGKVLLGVGVDPNVLIWSGIVGTTDWDFTTPNFMRGSVGALYTDGMPVSFNDMVPAGSSLINITVDVAPSIVSVASASNNFTFQGTGAIGGTAALIKDGTSKLTILTNNTYSGPTTINGGMIQVGNGAATGSLGTGPIADSGVLAFDRSDVVTVANAITGSGSLQQLGQGTLILTANNSYGATFIAPGATLQIGNGGATGSLGTGPLTNNGTLIFDRSGALNLAGGLGGTGGLSLTMPSVVTLNHANTYTGPTVIAQGVLSTNFLASGGIASGIGASTNAAANLVLDGGTLRYTGGETTTDRRFTLGPSGGWIDASGAAGAALNLTNPAPISFVSPTAPATLTLTGSSTGANTLAAPIVDAGTGPNVTSVVKNGGGTWVLTAANTYTGGTVVNHGTLRLDYAGPTVPVASGVAVTVSNDATLELAGATSALSDGTRPDSANITNNSTAAAGILISGTHQQVGDIDGSGNTQVEAGSTLIANRIRQTALIIGGAAESNAVVTIASTADTPIAILSSQSGGDGPGGLALSDSLAASGSFAAADLAPADFASLAGDDLAAADAAFGTAIETGAAPVVPEPSSLLLLALGAMAIGVASIALRGRATIG